MDEQDLYTLYEMDRGTVSAADRRRFLKLLQAEGQAWQAYALRMGPGFATAASELKRSLDADVLPAFQAVLERVTDSRFPRAYCDVRLYPQGREMDTWDGGLWEGERLSVIVSFVLAIPSDDSLDSMARMSLLSLFEDASWDPQVKKLGKKGRLKALLNVDTVNAVLSDLVFEHFNPYQLDGFTLEIIIDGCPDSRFDRLALAARGDPIQKSRSGRTVFKGLPGTITPDNVETEVPVLIAALAKALGVQRLDPSLLQTGDSLYALMGFDDTLTRSLTASLSAHFDVLAVVGGTRMVTVGDAIEFARDTLASRFEE